MNNETGSKMPGVTHLQFAVLEALGTATKRGKDLRKSLNEFGIKKSGPGFYQMMARMEEAGFVQGWYDQKIVEGQIIKERHYRITGKGINAFNRTTEFYQNTRAGMLLPALA